jgi:hypothetical protein
MKRLPTKEELQTYNRINQWIDELELEAIEEGYAPFPPRQLSLGELYFALTKQGETRLYLNEMPLRSAKGSVRIKVYEEFVGAVH